MHRRFPFAFDDRFRVPLALLGVRPSTAEVVVSDQLLDARFGPWRLQTPRSNIRSVEVVGPFTAVKALGPRASMSDHGVSFGTNADRGVCVTFHTPVGALLGRRWLRHPGMTVTVADPEGLAAALQPAGRPVPERH